MKLSEYRDDYYTFTGKLSDINRQLAFAGIALIWIFKQGNGSNVSIEKALLIPAILIVISLAMDMLQYAYQSITWAIFYTYYKGQGKSEDDKIKSSKFLNYPSWVLFTFKVLLTIISYWKICEFLLHKFMNQ